MAKIELLECWAGVAEPLRALMAEVEREADGSAPFGSRAVSTRWAQVRDAIRATVRARISRWYEWSTVAALASPPSMHRVDRTA